MQCDSSPWHRHRARPPHCDTTPSSVVHRSLCRRHCHPSPMTRATTHRRPTATFVDNATSPQRSALCDCWPRLIASDCPASPPPKRPLTMLPLTPHHDVRHRAVMCSPQLLIGLLSWHLRWPLSTITPLFHYTQHYHCFCNTAHRRACDCHPQYNSCTFASSLWTTTTQQQPLDKVNDHNGSLSYVVPSPIINCRWWSIDQNNNVSQLQFPLGMPIIK